MNPKREMGQGESLGGVGKGSGMLQAEFPREIHNSFNEKWERKAKSGFSPFGNAGVLLWGGGEEHREGMNPVWMGKWENRPHPDPCF